MDKMEKFTKTFKDWNSLHKWYMRLADSKQWVYRGQPDEKPLETALERAIVRFADTHHEKDFHTILSQGLNRGAKFYNVPRIEQGLLRLFKRRYYHYSSYNPAEDDCLEWLALMRHYGAPVRLLDWTYSFYVALYFALEKGYIPKDDGGQPTKSTVWLCNATWLDQEVKLSDCETNCISYEKADKNLAERKACFNKLFFHLDPKPMVYSFSPGRLNERLVIQQGTFLCPADVSKPFQDNLKPLLACRDAQQNFYRLKIDFSAKQRNDVLRHLYRMNMHRATLFPGLQGFAESLKTLLVFPEILIPEENPKKSK